jgi:DNA-directed RNA polymerase III subunit RPC11
MVRFCAYFPLILLSTLSLGMQYCCAACAYVRDIEKVYKSEVKLKNKQMGDVMGGDDSWQNVDKTQARCEMCQNDEAFFMQIQIRSADEPSTTFYKCCRCKHQWNDK